VGIGYTFTTPGAGGDPARDSDINTSGPFPGATSPFSLDLFHPADLARDAGLIGAAPSFGWAQGGGSTLTDSGFQVVADAAGNIYVTGAYTLGSPPDFDPGPGVVTSIPPPGASGARVFAAKYTAAGALLWVKDLTPGTAVLAGGIALGAADNIYVA